MESLVVTGAMTVTGRSTQMRMGRSWPAVGPKLAAIEEHEMVQDKTARFIALIIPRHGGKVAP